jgi:hypothetical protein
VSDAVVDYIIEAVRLVARDGWRLLPDYRFDNATGRWHHKDGAVEPPLRLRDIWYAADGTLTYPPHTARAPESTLAAYLLQGREILAHAEPPSGVEAHVSADYDDLRWFELPQECLVAV